MVSKVYCFLGDQNVGQKCPKDYIFDANKLFIMPIMPKKSTLKKGIFPNIFSCSRSPESMLLILAIFGFKKQLWTAYS